jgi:hypothetical protein
MLRDIDRSLVTAKVTHFTENELASYTAINLLLPYGAYLVSSITTEEKHKTLTGEGLWVPSFARQNGVASRLVRSLAYIAELEGVNTLTLHATSPYTIMSMCKLLGTKDLCCVQYIGSEDTKDCTAVEAIIALGVGETLGVDVTFTGSDLDLETEEPLVFRTIEAM